MPGATYDPLAQRVLLDGSFPAGWSPTPKPICTGNADDYNPAVAADGAGGLIVAADHSAGAIYDIYATWVPGGVVPTLLALVSAEATAERVLLTWYGAESAGLTARVERRTEAGEWAEQATVQADGEGTLRYDDQQIRPGSRYGYRLVYPTSSGEAMTAETWVTVPALEFALAGAQPNPVVDELEVAFSLAEDAPARLEVYDLAGRRVLAREVGELGAGTHRVRLASGGALPAGIYHLALTQGAHRAVARAVVTR